VLVEVTAGINAVRFNALDDNGTAARKMDGPGGATLFARD
jgi:hypothetical protein